MSIKRHFFMALRITLLFSAPAAYCAKESDPAAHLGKDEFKAFILPDDCARAFQDIATHIQFFEGAIASMAINKLRPQETKLPYLFAVSEMRADFQGFFPNLGEESPVDRLIVAQLCQFRKYRTQQLKPGQTQGSLIQSFDSDLQEHLAAIAPRLYQDVRTILVQALAKQAKLNDMESRYREKWREVLKARQLGREKVADILN